jgi:hypothetical protein
MGEAVFDEVVDEGKVDIAGFARIDAPPSKVGLEGREDEGMAAFGSDAKPALALPQGARLLRKPCLGEEDELAVIVQQISCAIELYGEIIQVLDAVQQVGAIVSGSSVGATEALKDKGDIVYEQVVDRGSGFQLVQHIEGCLGLASRST